MATAAVIEGLSTNPRNRRVRPLKAGEALVSEDGTPVDTSFVEVKDDGVSKVAEATKLNFGSSLLVTDEGSGQAKIDVVGSGGGILALTPIVVPFVASSMASFDVVLPAAVTHIIRGRAYISTDPGADFDDNLLWNFYSAATKRGEDLIDSLALPAIYRETVGSVVSNKVDVTGTNLFTVQDLVKFLGAPLETHRLISTGVGGAQEIETKDALTAYPAATGISLVSEMSGNMFTTETDKKLHMEIEAPGGAITATLTIELTVEI